MAEGQAAPWQLGGEVHPASPTGWPSTSGMLWDTVSSLLGMPRSNQPSIQRSPAAKRSEVVECAGRRETPLGSRLQQCCRDRTGEAHRHGAARVERKAREAEVKRQKAELKKTWPSILDLSELVRINVGDDHSDTHKIVTSKGKA